LEVDVSTLSQFTPGRIKSIQRGTISGSATATITAVDTAKSILTNLGHSAPGAGSIARLTFTNSTTITATNGGVDSPGTTGFQVVEYY
jgi:hypothetical protein